jgi:hypothetical protein
VGLLGCSFAKGVGYGGIHTAQLSYNTTTELFSAESITIQICRVSPSSLSFPSFPSFLYDHDFVPVSYHHGDVDCAISHARLSPSTFSLPFQPSTKPQLLPGSS